MFRPIIVQSKLCIAQGMCPSCLNLIAKGIAWMETDCNGQFFQVLPLYFRKSLKKKVIAVCSSSEKSPNIIDFRPRAVGTIKC